MQIRHDGEINSLRKQQLRRPSPLDPMGWVMEKSQPASGRSAILADMYRNR
jgi:hypothetical protein